MLLECQLPVLSSCRKCLLFQSLRRGIRMQIAILTGAQNGRISSWKNGHI